MNIQNRLKQLEKQTPKDRPTWRDFITGKWQPSPEEWHAFLSKAGMDAEQNKQQENRNDERNTKTVSGN